MWQWQDLAREVQIQRRRPTVRNRAPIQISDQDVRIFAALHRYKILERHQIQQLFFTSASNPAANLRWADARLKQLYDHGFIERIQRSGDWRRPNPGPAYRLARHGAEELAKPQGLDLSQFN